MRGAFESERLAGKAAFRTQSVCVTILVPFFQRLLERRPTRALFALLFLTCPAILDLGSACPRAHCTVLREGVVCGTSADFLRHFRVFPLNFTTKQMRQECFRSEPLLLPTRGFLASHDTRGRK